MMTTNTQSEARRTLRWAIAVSIALAVYFVVVELWGRLFFSGNAPGPYGLLAFHSRASTYVLLLPLLSIIFLLLVTLRLRRAEGRTPAGALLVAGLMFVLGVMLFSSSIFGNLQEQSAAALGEKTYYLVKDTSPSTGFANLILVECGSGLACHTATTYTQIMKSQDSARLDVSPSGELGVTTCSHLSGACQQIASVGP